MNDNVSSRLHVGEEVRSSSLPDPFEVASDLGVETYEADLRPVALFFGVTVNAVILRAEELGLEVPL